MEVQDQEANNPAEQGVNPQPETNSNSNAGEVPAPVKEAEEKKAEGGQMEEEKANSNVHDIPFDPDLMDKQHEEIRKEIEENSPLISDILPLEMLEFEFSDNQPFLIKIKV